MLALHGKSIVQRDLKPENILLHDPENRKDSQYDQLDVKISDFGLARVLDRRGEASTAWGTRSFWAPEVWEAYVAPAGTRVPYDDSVDLFSFGVMLFQCLTNKHPFIVGFLFMLTKTSCLERRDSCIVGV